MKKLLFITLFSLVNLAVSGQTQPYVMVLGVAQDGGYPHLGCRKKCCRIAWQNRDKQRNVVSLAIVNAVSKKWWLVEATPDIKQQLQLFNTLTKNQFPYLPEGIFITNAHIGHYTGLMEFGREVMNTKALTVYAMPKLKKYLTDNGPWSQLVKLNNINLVALEEDQPVLLSKFSVNAFRVPHRDEYSETVGFKIQFPNSKMLFIPDIHKWQKWDKNLLDEIKNVDKAFIDATFYNNNELASRPISEVPHPFVVETTSLFKNETEQIKNKVIFIHFNHTNPLMWDKKTQKEIKSKGFQIAEQGKTYP